MTSATEGLKKVYEGLKDHRGAINEVAERCKCSREWVRMVLKGVWKDDAVKEMAVTVLEERNERRADIERRMMATATV